MPHGVEPRSKNKQGPIPTNPDQLDGWWGRQTDWAGALDLCVKRKRIDAMLLAANNTQDWQGSPWEPQHADIRWIQGYLCRTTGLGTARAMSVLAPVIVAAPEVGSDGMLKQGLLVEATRADRADLVEWIIDVSFNKDDAERFWPHIAHIAASNGSLRCLDLAMERSPGIGNHTNAKGRTPLHAAAGYGQAMAIDKLLKAGADARARDEHGRTPLAALMTGHREVGGWPNNTAREGWQPMAMMLIREGDGPEQHYGKTPRAGSLVDRVRREVGPEIADELMGLGLVQRSQVGLEADTAAAAQAGPMAPAPRL